MVECYKMFVRGKKSEGLERKKKIGEGKLEQGGGVEELSGNMVHISVIGHTRFWSHSQRRILSTNMLICCSVCVFVLCA